MKTPGIVQGVKSITGDQWAAGPHLGHAATQKTSIYKQINKTLPQLLTRKYKDLLGPQSSKYQQHPASPSCSQGSHMR